MVEWQEITYPIALNYREHWGTWEAIREIVQNSLDSSESYTSYHDGNNLVIEDNGKGIEVKHLLFGISEKGENARGKFGEGLKIALIVLKRLGYTVEILSNNLEIKVSTKFIENQECLNILYRHNGENFKGTRITILNYMGPDYKERFINSRNTDIVFANSSYGQIIRQSEGTIDNPKIGKLYVKDIFVSNIDNSMYSYNLKDVRLEESRNMVSELDMQYQLGYLWSKVKDEELWVSWFNAVKEGKYEKKTKLFLNFSDESVVRSAFYSVFPNTVLKTSDTWEREARWRNFNVTDLFDIGEHSELFRIIDTDKVVVERDSNTEDIEVDENSLTPKEQKNLTLARNLALKIDKEQLVKTYILNDNTLGKAGNPIKLSRTILSSTQQVISTMVHELTHTYYGCDDLTGDMINRLSDLAATLLEEYVTKEFSTKVLCSRVSNGNVQYRVSIPILVAKEENFTKGKTVVVSIHAEN